MRASNVARPGPLSLVWLLLLVALGGCSRELTLPATPTPPAPGACGNGVVADDERCDDGNRIEGDGCDSNCTPSGCGNGVVAPTEGCDDANAADGDGCDSNCTVTACGNAVTTDGEGCDDGGESPQCDLDCTPVECGDGVQNFSAGEPCDDGNAADDDGCLAGADGRCRLAVCGDGARRATPAGLERCDAGGAQTATCELDCTEPACGDGVTNELAREACDLGAVYEWNGCFGCQLSEFQVNTAFIDDQQEVAVGMGAAGEVVYVWTGLDGEGRGIRGQRFAATGAPVGPELAINSVLGIDQHHPDVAVRADGSFVVVWMNEWQMDVRARLFDADGEPRDYELPVSADGLQLVTAPRVAIAEPDGDGRTRMLVVWGECCGDTAADPFNKALRGAWLTDHDGRLSVEPLSAIALDLTHEFNELPDTFDVAADEDGRFSVAWSARVPGGKQVKLRRYDAVLRPSAVEDVHPAPPGANDIRLSLGVDRATGALAVAWYAQANDGLGGGPGAFVRLFDADGTATTQPIRVDAEAPSWIYSVGVARSGPRVGVVWKDDDGRGDEDGAATQSLVFVRWFDGGGAPLGAPTRLGRHEASAQMEPKLASDGAGHFAAGWTSTGQEAHARGVFGDRFDAALERRGVLPY